MALGTRVRLGKRLTLALAAAAMLLVLFGSTTMAFAEVQQVTVGEKTIIIDPTKPVVKQTCSFCHANIANTKNYASEIIFSHGMHLMVQCSGCHAKFPHMADAAQQGVSTDKPTMKGCFNCHGLRHGPMGRLASDVCSDCHNTPKERLKPAFHTFGWRGTPHVAPANAEFNTKCAMCHKKESCTLCHDNEGVRWEPASWDYDSGTGCQSCHGSETLRKDSADGSKSFTVTGIDASAHRDVTCQQCHSDFRYDDKLPASKVWQVNAGYACAKCHQTAKKERDRAPVGAWKKSVHYAELQGGNAQSATCASCHSGHTIQRLDTDYAKQMLHGSAYRMCARCHKDEYASYDDYYHGAAYKKGASDAPACWECHNAHDILSKEDKASAVSGVNLAKTCGRCHKGSEDSFGEAAGQLIHEKKETLKQNPVNQLITKVRAWIS
ncbi:MAG: hypothetical protein HY876_04840 [Coriobacteriales bacterium]|nr:hypothetical protein [Coriobacteriales bacterium]